MTEWHKLSETPLPKGEMIIWAYRKDRKWSIGLAYLTVSGHYSDSETFKPISEHATHWKPIGSPPSLKPMEKDGNVE